MITFKKLSVPCYYRAVGDKKKPTGYAVFLDGKNIGSVFTKSSLSWMHGSNGVRYHFRGYERSWIAITPCGYEHQYNHSRSAAVEKLIKETL